MKRRKFRLSHLFIVLLLFLLFLYWYSIPYPLFSEPCSTVLEDQSGQLLGAHIASDHQWRFPEMEKVPEKFAKCIIAFEDRSFYYHPGFNPISLLRAFVQNISRGKVVSGGSSITMQVIRLSRKNPPRTYWEKLIEIILATRLELGYSKQNILALYASHAPFGGNVVGLEAAAWRYYGRSASQLSWGEAATLAVLPNSPALIFPGKNHDILLAKRNKLLFKLWQQKSIDKHTYELAVQEPLPGRPFPLPAEAPHLLNRAMEEGFNGKRIQSSIDRRLQLLVAEIIEKYNNQNEPLQIFNAAALVLDVKSGAALAYVGNTQSSSSVTTQGNQVDVIMANRSTGSILKPFLYAAMLNDGLITPYALVEDIPTQIGSYNPQNYNHEFYGAVPANKALSRSLNVPAVRMLRSYNNERFKHILQSLGMTTLTKPADYYGLALILGGAEGKLWEIAGIYAGVARTLNHYPQLNSSYDENDFRPPVYTQQLDNKHNTVVKNPKALSASSLWFMAEAMNEVSRPDEEGLWENFESSGKIAWKTGTSFGNRDAWSIGFNPDYVVAVWVGNCSGKGQPGLTGLQSAAPIMFDIFRILRPTGWFPKPYDDMMKLVTCRQSGYKASVYCQTVDTVWVPASCYKSLSCPYHKLIHLDASGRYRVNADCENTANILTQSWFVLPPVVEWYFKPRNPFYKSLPPVRSDCIENLSGTPEFDIIYPKDLAKIYVPVEITGEKGKVVFKAAHRNPKVKLFWYIDDEFVGETTEFHTLALCPSEGKHQLTLTDETGKSISKIITVVGKSTRGK